MPSRKSAALIGYIDRHLVEHFDGYLVLGFVAGKNDRILVCRDGGDQKTALAINAAIQEFMECGGAGGSDVEP